MSSSSSDQPSLELIQICFRSLQDDQSPQQFLQTLRVISDLNSAFPSTISTVPSTTLKELVGDQPIQYTTLDAIWLSYFRRTSQKSEHNPLDQWVKCLETINNVRDEALSDLNRLIDGKDKRRARKKRVTAQWLLAVQSGSQACLETSLYKHRLQGGPVSALEEQLARIALDPVTKDYRTKGLYTSRLQELLVDDGVIVTPQDFIDSLAPELARHDFRALAKCLTTDFPHVYNATLELLKKTQSGQSTLASSAQTAQATTDLRASTADPGTHTTVEASATSGGGPLQRNTVFDDGTTPSASSAPEVTDLPESVDAKESVTSGSADSTDTPELKCTSSTASTQVFFSLKSGPSSQYLGVDWPKVEASDPHGDYNPNPKQLSPRASRRHLVSSRSSGVMTRPSSPVGSSTDPELSTASTRPRASSVPDSKLSR
ncbi:hypothetical protein BCR39DRAFT_596398 [Naematelia encephala]|uniref:Uncharacterized protein n=1 Tax=Naematelia encephala TaxID=71784 RepID=A0A1Y2BM12_9TREE|nr:hypothetical protein BCR39DRAFT_596398 [Naematelia encephala]